MTPTLYTFGYLCERMGLSPSTLRRYVSEGLVEPYGKEGRTLLFDEVALERLEIIERLKEELGVNLAGIHIILRLTSRIRSLQDKLQRMEAEQGKGHGFEEALGDGACGYVKIMGRTVMSIDMD